MGGYCIYSPVCKSVVPLLETGLFSFILHIYGNKRTIDAGLNRGISPALFGMTRLCCI